MTRTNFRIACAALGARVEEDEKSITVIAGADNRWVISNEQLVDTTPTELKLFIDMMNSCMPDQVN